MYVCRYVCLYVCMYLSYLYIYIYLCCVYVCLSMCMYVSMYVSVRVGVVMLLRSSAQWLSGRLFRLPPEHDTKQRTMAGNICLRHPYRNNTALVLAKVYDVLVQLPLILLLLLLLPQLLAQLHVSKTIYPCIHVFMYACMYVCILPADVGMCTMEYTCCCARHLASLAIEKCFALNLKQHGED